MRKLLLLLVLIVLAWFAYRNRYRIFVRDPLGSVVRDGVKEKGAQVYVNYPNDVMIENDNAPMYFNLIEAGQPVSAPTGLKCIHYLACLANGYPEPQTFALPGAKLESMTAREVDFRDPDGRQVVVRLR